MRVASSFRGFIGTLDAKDSATALGGLNLDVHHTYSPDGRTLFEGNGTFRGVDDLESLTPVHAGDPRPYEGFVIASDGTMYFNNSGYIFRRRPGGTVERFTFHRGGFGGDGGPVSEATLWAYGLAIGPEGDLFVADGNNYRIRRIDLRTERIYTEAYIPDHVFRDVAFGPDGSMYALSNSFRIERRGPDGTWTLFAGAGTTYYLDQTIGDGGPATQATFATSGMMAVDSGGRVYVADSRNNRVRMIDTTGIITTVVGGLYNPSHVVAAPDGSLYISEYAGGYRLLRLGVDGVLYHIAGGYGVGDPHPINPAGSVPKQVLLGIEAIALGPDGSLYFGHTCLSIVSCGFGLSRMAPCSPAIGPKTSRCRARTHPSSTGSTPRVVTCRPPTR